MRAMKRADSLAQTVGILRERGWHSPDCTRFCAHGEDMSTQVSRFDTPLCHTNCRIRLFSAEVKGYISD